MPRVTHIRDVAGDVGRARNRVYRTYRRVPPPPCFRLTPEEVRKLEAMAR